MFVPYVEGSDMLDSVVATRVRPVVRELAEGAARRRGMTLAEFMRELLEREVRQSIADRPSFRESLIEKSGNGAIR